MVTVPALTVVAKIAPNATKAPPSTLRTRMVRKSVDARLTPASSARMAKEGGIIASKLTETGELAGPEDGGSLGGSSWFRLSFIGEKIHPYSYRPAVWRRQNSCLFPRS